MGIKTISIDQYVEPLSDSVKAEVEAIYCRLENERLCGELYLKLKERLDNIPGLRVIDIDNLDPQLEEINKSFAHAVHCWFVLHRYLLRGKPEDYHFKVGYAPMTNEVRSEELKGQYFFQYTSSPAISALFDQTAELNIANSPLIKNVPISAKLRKVNTHLIKEACK